jgi:hypothetical protein
MLPVLRQADCMDEGVGSDTTTPADAVSAWLRLPGSGGNDERPRGAAGASGSIGPGNSDVSLFALEMVPDAESDIWKRLDAAGDPLEAALSIIAQAAASGAEEAAFFWPPARLWSRFDRDFVAPTIAAMHRQGLPPVMHLVSFTTTLEDASITVATRGLAFFAGAELRLSGPSLLSERDALRSAARLAIDAMLQRGSAGPMIVDGLNKGERLRLGAPTVEDGDRVIPVEWIPPGP